MRTLEDVKKTLSEQKEGLKKNFQVKEIGIFGSYVRRTQKEKRPRPFSGN
jgi:predicted nucleotidyltransferase